MTTIGAEGGAVKVMGIDVGKTRLDASAEGGPVRCFANDGPGIAALLGWLRAQGAELVVANPPADTKDPWCGACLVRGLPGVGSAWCGVWVNVGCRCIWPIPTGRSWPASGKPAKTDRLDAQILSRYGQVFALEGDPQREPR